MTEYDKSINDDAEATLARMGRILKCNNHDWRLSVSGNYVVCSKCPAVLIDDVLTDKWKAENKPKQAIAA